VSWSKFKPIVPNSLYCAPCTYLSLCVKYNFPRSWGDRCRGGAKLPVGCTREEVAADLLLLEPKTPMMSKLQSLLHTTWPQLVRPRLPPVVLSSPSPVVHSLPSPTSVTPRFQVLPAYRLFQLSQVLQWWLFAQRPFRQCLCWLPMIRASATVIARCVRESSRTRRTQGRCLQST
jgi:hypothetical protein